MSLSYLLCIHVVSLARLSRGRRESGQTPIVELCNLVGFDDVNLSGAKWV